MHRRLATFEGLQKFGITVPPKCVFCGHNLESFTHLLFECYFTRQLCNKLGNWLGHARQIQNWQIEITWIGKLAKSKQRIAEITSCIFAMMINRIWHVRNSNRFKQTPIQADQIIKEMVMHLHVRGRDSTK